MLVHIGYHKTGTTWLQSELFTESSDIFFPLAKAGESPKYLGDFFVRDADGYTLSPFRSNKTRIMEEVDRILAEGRMGERIPVISHERLSGNPHSGGFDAKVIADRLCACFPQARILCVIREQKDAILSTYFQYLKAGGTGSLQNYLCRGDDRRRPGFSPAHFRYEDLVNYYIELFSARKVLVLPYEMLRDRGDEFIDRIGDFLQVEIPAGGVNIGLRHNKGLNRVVESKLRLLNLFTRKTSLNAYSPLCIPGLRDGLDAVKGAVGSLVPSKYHASYIQALKAGIEAMVGDRYRASNRRLSEAIDIDLSRYGYDD